MFNEKIIETSASDILHIEVVDENTILYSNALNELKFFDVDTMSINLTLKVANKEGAFLFCFSLDKKMLAYVSDNHIHIVDTKLQHNDYNKTVTTLNKIALCDDITCITFDPSSRYIFVGTLTNVVYQYKFDSPLCLCAYNLFDVFKKRTKGITSIEFYDDIMFISGNRGDLVKVNIYSKISENIFLDESTTINDMKFLDEQYLLTAHENGEIRLVDTNTFNSYNHIATPFISLKKMLFFKNRHYMLLCSNTNDIALLDVNNKKCIAPKYISCEKEIQSISLVSQYVLIILLIDNTLLRVNLPTPKQLDSLIVHGSLDEAYMLANRDPMLKDSLEYQNLEQIYTEIIQRVAQEIPNNNKDFALQTIGFFKNVTSKKDEIISILDSFDRYSFLQTFVFENNYEAAYKLVERYPIYKYLKVYKIMESTFQTQLDEAQKLLFKNHTEGAYALIGKYLNIKSKQTVVKLFLHHGKEFLSYLLLLKNRDIQGLKEAVKIDKNFLKYVNALNIDISDHHLDNPMHLFNSLLDNSEFEKAKELLDMSDELRISEDVLNKKLLHSEKLCQLYKDKNFLECYILIDKHAVISTLKITTMFEKNWKRMIIKVENDLILGKEKSLNVLIAKYAKLDSRKEKIDDLRQHMEPIVVSNTEDNDSVINYRKIVNDVLFEKVIPILTKTKTK